LDEKQNIKTIQAINESEKIPLVKLIILFSVIVTILNCIIVFKRGVDDYDESVVNGQKGASRLISTLSDHINLTFLAVDISLKRAIEREYLNELFGKNLQMDMQNNFNIWVNETPQISAMLMSDENGKIEAIYRKKGYKTWFEDKDTVTGYNFFEAHKRSNNSELLYVSQLDSWIQNHDGFVILSRRLNKLNGKFGGVVVIAVNSDYVKKYFRSVTQDKKTKLVVMRRDYKLLINQLKDKDEATLFTDIISQNKITSSQDIQKTVVHEGSKQDNGIDDKLRLFSFKKIPNLHSVLAIITYGEDIFNDWKKQRISDVIYLAIFILFVFVVSSFVVIITKQMQRAKRSESSAILASQAKSDFLANMSHELRTPLNAVIGFSEMLEAGYFGNLNNKQKERIHDINYCGTHLLELINDILDFSKGEAGKIDLYLKKTSVDKLVKESIRVLSENAKREKIKVINNIPNDLPYAMIDARKIKQILLNLLSNAIKFTKENGTIELSSGIDEDRNLIISVTDTGIGIKEENITKALSAFGQVHDNENLYGGTGLGLPLSKMFANLHGGDITIHSIYGVGTKVSIIIPKDKVIWSASNTDNLVNEDE